MNVEKLIIDIANGIARDINTALMVGINMVTYEEHAFIERFHVNFEHPHTLLIDATISAIESPTIALR